MVQASQWRPDLFYLAWTLSTAKSLPSPWQTGQVSTPPSVSSCTCAAVTGMSWQDVQADVIGRVSMVSSIVFLVSIR